MEQRGNFIKDPTRTENKMNKNNGGKFLYYRWAVDPMLLMALGSVYTDQSKIMYYANDVAR